MLPRQTGNDPNPTIGSKGIRSKLIRFLKNILKGIVAVRVNGKTVGYMTHFRGGEIFFYTADDEEIHE